MKRGLISFCALLAVFSVLPAGAWAGGARASKAKHGTSSEFIVPGPDGYWLDVKSEGGFVTAVASTHWPPVATVSAAGVIRPANAGNVASDTYVTFPAPSDPNVIAADFGSAGSISVVFQPSGKVHVTKLNLKNKVKHCNAPHRIVRRLGTFTGTIKFQGEGGYTSIDLTSAKGSVGTSPFRSCTNKRKRHGAGAQKSSSVREASLLAIPKGNSSPAVSFIASKGRGGANFSAHTVEPLTKNLFVIHSAQASAPANSFTFHRAPSSATIRPPAPFSGVGIYRGGHSSPAWTGDLSVAFPGFEAPLTGSAFDVQFFPWG